MENISFIEVHSLFLKKCVYRQLLLGQANSTGPILTNNR